MLFSPIGLSLPISHEFISILSIGKTQCFNINHRAHLIFTKCTFFRVHDNLDLESITFPTHALVVTRVSASSCGLTGTVNLSGLTKLSGTIELNFNTQMTGINLPASAEIITLFSVSFGNLTGTLDLSSLTKLSGVVELVDHPLLTGVTLPPSAEVFTRISLQKSDLGYVDFTVLSAVNDNIDIIIRDNSMTAGEVNNILDDLDNEGWINGTLSIAGTNAAPDGASGGFDGLTAKANLIANGWTVSTN